MTFEGFLLEADDSRGPFVRVDKAYWGVTEGGEWSADPCDYPYAHSEPFTLGPSAADGLFG